MAVFQYAHQNGCEWGPHVCSAAAERGNLSILEWLRQHTCPWDSRTTCEAAICNHLEVLKWVRKQQPPCPWWPLTRKVHYVRPSVLVFLWRQQAPLSASHLAQACAAATEITCAVLSLRAALPNRTPDEVVHTIVSLASS